LDHSFPVSAPSSSLRPINAGRVVFKWTFENDPATKLEPKDASQFLAQWSWEPPGPNGRRGSLVSKVENSKLIFPFILKRGPYLLEITAKPDRADSFCNRTSGLADDRILPRKHWRTRKKFKWKPDVARVAGAWFFENRFILFHDEQVTWLQSFKTDCAGARFTSTATNLRIEEIVIREFAPEDVPERLRDPERLLAEEDLEFAGESWAFDDGIPADLKIFGKNAPALRPGPWANRQTLAAESGQPTVVLLPTKAPDGPFSVIVRTKLIRRTDSDFGVFWSDGKNSPAAETYATGKLLISSEWREWTVLFTGRYAFYYFGDAPREVQRPQRLYVFETPRPAETVAVLLNNLSVEEIRLEVERPETTNVDEEKIREMIKDAGGIPWRTSNGGTLLEQEPTAR
jgi:hypothetical protein